jgi:ATP-dependent RNA helicase RhlE
MSFHAFGLSEPILRAVAAEGYTTPTPIQSQAIPHVLAGRDLLGCAQTGTGKTAAFALPILHRLTDRGNSPRPKGAGRRIRVLVLTPTRELAAQIAESFRAYGQNTTLRQTVVFGGVGQDPQVRALRHGVDILVATPGRLLDLINQGHVDFRGVETFVLDEADRMLDMGFLPDVRRIIARLPQERQTLFFSATMPAPIEQLAGAILRDPVRVRIAPVQATTELIEQSVCFVPKHHKPQLLAKLLAKKSVTRAIVFTRTKRGADRVARHLNQSGIRAEAMHGNKSQSARQRTFASFKSKCPPILVATDLAARGIDVDGISHVFNFDLPHEPETYLHRIGRTGRAGATGRAISFCDQEERPLLKDIERLIRRTLDVDKDHPAPAPALPTAEPGNGGHHRARHWRGRSNGHAQPLRPAHSGNGHHASGRPASGGFFGRRRKKRRHANALRA